MKRQNYLYTLPKLNLFQRWELLWTTNSYNLKGDKTRKLETLHSNKHQRSERIYVSLPIQNYSLYAIYKYFTECCVEQEHKEGPKLSFIVELITIRLRNVPWEQKETDVKTRNNISSLPLSILKNVSLYAFRFGVQIWKTLKIVAKGLHKY